MSTGELEMIRAREVCELLKISKPTLWRWTRSGVFPQPVRYGPNTVGWPISLVADYLDRQAKSGEERT